MDGGAKRREEHMEIAYRDTKEFEAKALEDLFLSVEWSSGHYPDKLVAAMRHSATVFSAWEGEKLVGLANVLDDGVMTAYVHYLLVNPACQGKGIGRQLLEMVKDKYKDYLRIVLVAYNDGAGFYEQCGFVRSEGACPMYITSLWT